MLFMVSIIYIICTKIYNIKYTRVYNVQIGPSDEGFEIDRELGEKQQLIIFI